MNEQVSTGTHQIRNSPFAGECLRFTLLMAIVGTMFLSGCDAEHPSTPVIDGTPRFEFVTGRILTYTRQDFDWNGNPVPDSFSTDSVEVVAAGEAIGGRSDAAIVKLTNVDSRGISSRNLLTMAMAEREVLLYNGSSGEPNLSPRFPTWNVLFNVSYPPDTLLSFDSTFVLTMLSGSQLRDRVTYVLSMRFESDDRIAAFGAPIIACSVYRMDFSYRERVDTADIVLYDAPALGMSALVWFADGIGPVRVSAHWMPPVIDSLAFPRSVLQVVHTSTFHDSYKVLYQQSGGRDVLLLREEPAMSGMPVAMLIMGSSKNF